MDKNHVLRVLAASLSLLAVVSPISVNAQYVLREMNSSEFFQSRPKSTKGGTRRVRKYKQAGVAGAAPTQIAPVEAGAVSRDAEIGFTTYLVRKAVASDPQGTREITHGAGGKQVEWALERISNTRGLAVEERFRFAIETPRRGYLYVIDRTHYASGTRQPVLIFPTTGIHGGANEVQGGRFVELPSRDDETPYYHISKPGSDRLVAEEVIVLVTPMPLCLEIGEKPLELTDALVAEWEKRWGAPTDVLESVDAEGALYTTEEKAAGMDASKLLSQDDPGPQTIYRIASREGAPLFLRVMIPIRDDAGTK